MTESKKDTWLIVGLGNPGKEYAGTKHNCGFRAMDILAEKLGCKIDKSKFQGLYGKTVYRGNTVYLLKPQTFMNASGRSVAPFCTYFRISPQQTIVLFDDISLPPGRLRIRGDGSAGGHNGIKSIIAELGSQDFPRVKIGVGEKPHKDADLADWVLSGFTPQAEKAMAFSLNNAADAALCILEHGVFDSANRFNGSHP